MSALAVFAFGEQMVRIIDRDGSPWFVGRDVCAALALTNPAKSLGRIPDDEKGVTIGDTLGGKQEMTIISEPGMYRLVLTSRTEAAERFKTWVVSEVLPAIRRTGAYIRPAANDADLPDDGIDYETETGRASVLTRLALVRAAARTFGRAAAQEAWRRSGLPDVDVRAAAGFVGVEDEDVRAWLNDRVEFVPGDRTQSSVLYADYLNWCGQTGRTARSLTFFGRRMRASGIVFVRSGNIFAMGVRLKFAESIAA